MDNLEYLAKKGESSNKNKNLYSLPLFFTEKELDQLSKKSIAIVGTNGKTSTAGFIFQYFLEAGISACRFTSPHLVQVNERIQTSSGLIKDKELVSYLDEVIKFERKEGLVLGYFEALFLICCKSFLDMQLEIFIVEAGIGGRLDTTSIINSENVVLTNVGYDHTEILGESLEEILMEKIHISSRVKNFFSGDTITEWEFGDLIRKELGLSLNKGPSSKSKGDYFVSSEPLQNGYHLFENRPRKEDFRLYNGALAQRVFSTLSSQRGLKSNIAEMNFRSHFYLLNQFEKESGRFEIIHSNDKTFKIIDGAHNSFAIPALKNFVSNEFPVGRFPRVECFLGIKTGKDFEGILDALAFNNTRGEEAVYGISLIEGGTFRDQINPEAIAEYLTEIGVKYKYASLDDFHSYNEPSILLGSLYLVGEYIKEFR